jgi:capsular polysaccharide biosynthesis protein
VVDPSTGLVFAGDHVLAQSAYGWRNASDGAFLSTASTRARRTDRRGTLEGPLAPFGGAIYNYYHFLIETLPRILHIRSVEPTVTVTLTAPLSPHIPAVLGELGINYVLMPTDSFIADDVYLCDAAPHPWPHPANIRVLHNLPVGEVDVGSQYPSKIHVSRTGSGRQLGDSHLLDEYLEDLGYVTIRLETLPWAEQVAHFRAARSVVAAHGAGLANTAFMRPGSDVVELTTGTWWFPSMRNVAHLSGVNHQLVQLPYEADHPHGTALASVEALKSLDL